MTLLRRLACDSLIYGLGGMFSKGLTFLLLPVYTRLFSPAEYGLIEMVTVTGLLLETTITLGQDSAQSFFFFKKPEEGKSEAQERSRIITAVFTWRMLWGFFLLAVFALSAPSLNARFYGGQLQGTFLVCFLVSVWANQSLGHASEIYRLMHRPWAYVALNVLSSAGTAVTCLVLTLGFRLGLKSYFLALAAFSLLAASMAWFSLRSQLNWRQAPLGLLPRLLRFGIPFLPSALGYYAIASSDRWMISWLLGTEVVGAYAAAGRMALVVSLFVSTFRLAWWPVAMELIHRPEGPAVLRSVAEGYFFIGAAVSIVLGMLSHPLMLWLTPREFHQASGLVGLLTWNSILFGAFLIVSLGIWQSQKTFWSPVLMLAAAVIYYGLAWFCLPMWGLAGAAAASVTASLVWIALTLVVSEALWPVGYNRLVLAGVVGLGLTGAVIPLFYNALVSFELGWIWLSLLSLFFYLRHGKRAKGEVMALSLSLKKSNGVL